MTASVRHWSSLLQSFHTRLLQASPEPRCRRPHALLVWLGPHTENAAHRVGRREGIGPHGFINRVSVSHETETGNYTRILEVHPDFRLEEPDDSSKIGSGLSWYYSCAGSREDFDYVLDRPDADEGPNVQIGLTNRWRSRKESGSGLSYHSLQPLLRTVRRWRRPVQPAHPLRASE